MTALIEKAYNEGMCDALSGRDYANPYIPPAGSDETFDWKSAHEDNYHRGYEAHVEASTGGAA